jgi:LemA protein
VDTVDIVLIVAALLVVDLIVWAVIIRNRLVRQRNQCRSSWAQIDVQLTRRYDLVPNLVEVVKAYAAHERDTLQAVIDARNVAQHAARSGPSADRAAAENALTQSIGRIFALGEAYPDLKANQNYAQLQRELTITEDKIAYARQFYNSAVETLSNTIGSFPSNLIAGMGGFQPPPYFQADERGPVTVRF